MRRHTRAALSMCALVAVVVCHSWVKQQLPGRERAYSLSAGAAARGGKGKSELAQLW
jgi:hypothetical protein